MDKKKIAKELVVLAKSLIGGFEYYKFHSKGDLHRNVLLNTLEDEYGITFKDYDSSTTGIKAKNSKTEKILKKLFGKAEKEIIKVRDGDWAKILKDPKNKTVSLIGGRDGADYEIVYKDGSSKLFKFA